MIEKYIITKEQNEEVLYIELNFNYEFSKINIFQDINSYLKRNKIKFNGKKIIFTIFYSKKMEMSIKTIQI